MANKALVERGGELENWDPFQGFGAQPFGGLWEGLFAPSRGLMPSGVPSLRMPRVDIQEMEDQYVLTAALPGARKEDVKVDVKDNILTISAEQKAEKEEKQKSWLRREISYGSYQRSFALPEGMHPEEVKASFKDGMLSISMRKPPLGKSRGVAVKVD